MVLLPIVVLVLHRILLLLLLTQVLLLSVAIVFSCQARKHHLVPPPDHWQRPDLLSTAQLVFTSVDGSGPPGPPAWAPGEEPRVLGPKERGDKSCVVCVTEMGEGEEVRELRCGHLFHRACLDRWVGYGHGTCPLCRLRLGRGGRSTEQQAPQGVRRGGEMGF